MEGITAERIEPRTFPKGNCPVDLMGELRKINKGSIAFELTSRALYAMLSYPVEKNVHFVTNLEGGEQKLSGVAVQWLPSKETMLLSTVNCGETYIVISANTEEIRFNIKGVNEVMYCIDVE